MTQTLGARLREAREAAGLGQRQVATTVGISVPYLSQLESGKRVPSDEVRAALADALGVTLDAEPAAPVTGRADELAAWLAADPDLSAEQARTLRETYAAFAELTRLRRARGRRP